MSRALACSPSVGRRPAAEAAFALLVVLTSVGCHSSGVPARNVLLISVDTLRADHLGCYEGARDTSPRLDALAAWGTRFTHAYAPASWTLPKAVPFAKAMSIRFPDVILLRPERGQPWVAFDPVRDPLEQVPLPVRDPALLRRADDAFGAAELPKSEAASAPEGPPLSEHLEEQFRALGYVE